MKHPATLPCIFVTLIALVTLLVFSPAYQYGYVDYDDPAYITKNPYVNSGIDAKNLQWAFTMEQTKGLPQYPGIMNLYHPVTWSSHMLDVELFGADNPQAQHIVNILIHTAGAILLFFCIRLLFRDDWIAFFTAVLFAIHPLHVESVAWLTARKDTLSGFFLFGSLLLYLLSQSAENQRKKIFLIASVIIYTLALLSKSSVVIFPGILVLSDVLRAKKLPTLNLSFFLNQLKNKLPWIVPAIAVAFISLMLQSEGSHEYFIHQNSTLSRLMSIPSHLTYYIYRTFAPTSLSFHYVQPPFQSSTLLSISIVFWSVALFVSYYFRKNLPTIGFATFWFLICILPMSGILYVGTSYTADRYSYLAIIGIFCLVSFLLKTYTPKGVWLSCFALIISTCGYLAHKQTKVWENSFTLFENATKAQPRDPTGFTNLAATYQSKGKVELATYYFKETLKRNKYSYKAYHNLGVSNEVYFKDLDKAESYYNKALKSYPYHLPTLKRLASFYLKYKERQNFDLSNKYLTTYNTQTKFADPNILGLHIKVLVQLGQKDNAKELFEKLKKLPNLKPKALEGLRQLLRK